MERRKFLSCCAAASLARAFPAAGSGTAREASPLADLLIADPHAHPHQLHGSRAWDSTTPTLDIMRRLGMTLCSFSAVGDMTFMRGRFGTPFDDTLNQLGQVRHWAEEGRISLVLKAADLQTLVAARTAPGGLMAIEGADALEGRLENLDVFRDYGVRMMTLLHDRDNEAGFNQRSGADGTLTPFGVKVVEKMNASGMAVDVAHAKTATLKSIAAVSAAPLVDSHTSPVLHGEESAGPRRLRTWQEMEWVAGTGGVVCTWPLAYAGKHAERTTLGHWADEVVRMKARLGIEHCGLGTDGGGGLPRCVRGWDSIASLPALIDALREAGLTRDDVSAFVGGNFLRVLGKCLA